MDEITGLLRAWSAGDPVAQERLIPLVYDELRRIARSYRHRAGAGDTLRTTALVHEAYLRLVNIPDVDWKDRVHFFALSAQLMRRILVDAARARGASKRGGDAAFRFCANLDELPSPSSERAAGVIALDDALSRLAEIDPHRARIVELRVFGGLTAEETGETLGVSSSRVARDWRLAKAWLLREFERGSLQSPAVL